MHIIIMGLGYVGLTTAGCLTKQGHKVTGIDISEGKVNALNKGEVPISEPGLAELLEEAEHSSLFSASYKVTSDMIQEADVVMVCVGTPSASDGSHNMTYILEVSKNLASLLSRTSRQRPLTVAYRSTIRPGSLNNIINPIFNAILGNSGCSVELVYNPEFLRESTAIADYFSPPKIIVGTCDGKPSRNMEEVYSGIDAPRFYTNFMEAEFTKFVDNTFHALKVSFANEIGRICLNLGIDAKKVHEIFIADTKLNISPYYLRPGGPFGGSCLPKDVRALQYIANDCGANTHVVDSLIRSNEAHKTFLYQFCASELKEGARVLMLGVAFKSSTDDLRESPNLDLARKLLEAGFSLQVYDPSLIPEKLTGQNLGWAYSHLPSLDRLLRNKAEIESARYDLVIDTNGTSGSIELNAKRIIDINTL